MFSGAVFMLSIQDMDPLDEVFASLDADPHASARARAAHARRAEDRVTHTPQPRTRKAVNRWRS